MVQLLRHHMALSLGRPSRGERWMRRKWKKRPRVMRLQMLQILSRRRLCPGGRGIVMMQWGCPRQMW